METATLKFRDEVRQVPFSLKPEEISEAKVKDKAKQFLTSADIDEILRYLAQEIIDDAYSQDDEDAFDDDIFDKYAEIYAQIEIESIDFYDDDLSLNLKIEGADVRAQISYGSAEGAGAGNVQDWEIDIHD